MAEVLTSNLGVWGGLTDSIAGELHFELDRTPVLMYTEVEGTKDIFGLHEKMTSSICGSQMDRSERSFRCFLGWGCKSFLPVACSTQIVITHRSDGGGLSVLFHDGDATFIRYSRWLTRQ